MKLPPVLARILPAELAHEADARLPFEHVVIHLRDVSDLRAQRLGYEIVVDRVAISLVFRKAPTLPAHKYVSCIPRIEIHDCKLGADVLHMWNAIK